MMDLAYHDPETGASVKLEDTAEGLKLEGIISRDYRIKPAENGYAANGLVAHEVAKMTKKDVEYRTAYAENTMETVETMNLEEGRQSSDCVTVEVMCVADYSHQKPFDSDDSVTWYHVILANSINIQYTELSKPRVAIVVVGVVRNKDTGSQPYIQNNLRDNGKVVTTRALYDFRDYFNNNRKDLKYDVCLLMTALDLADESSSGSLNRNVAGIAFVRATCSYHRYGISEDVPGAYDGVHTETHELGHSLGSDHDGSGQGSSCSGSDGYIMGTSHPSNGKWSSCSKSQIQKYVTSSNGDCLRSWQNDRVYKSDRLAGQTVTRQRRCELLHADRNGITSFRPSNAKPCNMYCRTPSDSNGRYYYWTHDDADGQECGTDQICWNLQCVAKRKVPWGC